jgi:hypothetical protein
MSDAPQADAPQVNTSFHPDIPGLQIAWDSTSIGALKTCPRYYQYSIVEGWSPRATSVHLIFGQHYHSALEHYDHARSAGKDHEEATLVAVRHALEVTWDQTTGRPWVSDDSNKNRYTLVRTIVWYLEHFKVDPATTVQLANGKPAVELSFRFEISHTMSDGQPYFLCGHLDRLAEFADNHFVLDRKTTSGTISADFFKKFAPDNQFRLYAFASKVIYGLPVEGVIVDGAQIAVGFSRFMRGQVFMTDDQLEEWYDELGMWLKQAEWYAKMSYWPQNEKSCGMYGGCQFRDICSMPKGTREQWLRAGYVKRIWDPLKIRGDI